VTTTLADIKRATGLEVLDHLELEVAIPVLGGVQAQGDLIVIPLAVTGDEVGVVPWARWLTTLQYRQELTAAARMLDGSAA